MPDFEHYSATAESIAKEIERKMVSLHADWHEEADMRALASKVLDREDKRQFAGLGASTPEEMALAELCGLVEMMLRTMQEGAEYGQHIHGTDAWKALARALWESKEGNAEADSAPKV